MIKEGDLAPEFCVNDQDGNQISLNMYKGKKIVLYFYPRDNTPGCTTEACDFRDRINEFENLDAVVIGVSKDSEKSHIKFRDKLELPFILLSDTELEVHRKFGTWVEKKMYGKTYMGTQRATFIIGSDGKIAKVYPKVRVKGHVEQVGEDLKEYS